MEENIRQDRVKTYVFIGIVCVLLIFSVAQTFQINNVKKELTTGRLEVSGAVKSSSGNAVSPRQAVPAMVGGC